MVEVRVTARCRSRKTEPEGFGTSPSLPVKKHDGQWGRRQGRRPTHRSQRFGWRIDSSSFSNEAKLVTSELLTTEVHVCLLNVNSVTQGFGILFSNKSRWGRRGTPLHLSPVRTRDSRGHNQILGGRKSQSRGQRTQDGVNWFLSGQGSLTLSRRTEGKGISLGSPRCRDSTPIHTVLKSPHRE